jgi:hypothetical protein
MTRGQVPVLCKSYVAERILFETSGLETWVVTVRARVQFAMYALVAPQARKEKGIDHAVAFIQCPTHRIGSNSCTESVNYT